MTRKTREREEILPGVRKLNSDLRETLDAERGAVLFLFDLDSFGKINRNSGIQHGDRLIRNVEKFLLEQRVMAYRVGGEEFAVLIDENAGYSECERLKSIVQYDIHEKSGTKVTISGGSIRHPGREFGCDRRVANLLYAAAEQLLITAKKQGRDKIVPFPPKPIRSQGIMNAMVKFYRELARINASDNEEEFTSIVGLPNSRAFEKTLDENVRNSLASSDPMSLLLLFPESMEEIARQRGDDACDRFLVDIARILKDVVRASDYIGHLDDDYFAILLEKVDARKAKALAERLQKAIAERTEGTISIGIYSGMPVEADSALSKARHALVMALSDGGKNRVALVST